MINKLLPFHFEGLFFAKVNNCIGEILLSESNFYDIKGVKKMPASNKIELIIKQLQQERMKRLQLELKQKALEQVHSKQIQLDLERLNLDREREQLERKQKILEHEQKQLQQERKQLDYERKQLRRERLERQKEITIEAKIDANTFSHEIVSGIYFLYDAAKRLVYIGKSVNLNSRILSSIDTKSRDMNEPILYCRFASVYNKPELGIYEAYYISKYRPAFNGEGIYDGELKLTLPELAFTDYIEKDKLKDMLPNHIQNETYALFKSFSKKI